ncbi:DDB1- and CUL4-associated factor 8-like isoform X2 [Bombus fervidus]|uniref:DDB1- and CUL4-associated factor 8-like isoform X2 n=1 Tax=Bombus fervidus TaxID=203811 RepID=UPI003AB7234B
MSSKNTNEKVLEIDAHVSKHYDIIRRLGKGAYGIVWKAIDKKNKETVAVKKIFDAFRNQTDAQRTFREIMFLLSFANHDNIIRLIGLHKANNDRDIYLVFEYMETDLHNVIKKGKILKDLHKVFIMYQLFKAIKYIHSGNVIHRDLKPSNVLLNAHCHCKIADFGLARSVTQIGEGDGETASDPTLTDYVATRWYRAPEILVASKRYTKGIDMWSLGCILGEMLLGKPLFPGSSTINQVERIMATLPPPTREDLVSVSAGYGTNLLEKTPNAPRRSLKDLLPEVPEKALDLISNLIVFNPNRRLTAVEALEHPYVADFHRRSNEPERGSNVVPLLRDDVQLSVDEYRNKLYSMMDEKHRKHKNMSKSRIRRLSEHIRKETVSSTSEEESEESQRNIPPCLRKKRPKPTWFVVPELLHREMGINSSFQRRYYGSLHVVEHFELMYKLKEHEGCVNALNFNKKGNLLASGSDDLYVVIWDWAIGKKHHSFASGHRSNMFQAKWLPFDEENLMATCARDGQVRLLDIRRGVSRKLATHNAPTHKLALHPDTPHVIVSVGEDAKVLSIDIREEKPTKLLVVRDGTFHVQLYSVHCNPLKSNEFCVAGRSQRVRVYDRRNVSKPIHELCPSHLTDKKHVHVTCALYNYDGTEVLASYNDEDVYLFDAISPQLGDFAHKYEGHRNNATVKGVNFFGPKSEFVISGSDCGNIFIWDKNTEAIVNWMPGDEQGVVNCLEPHPHIPILATSGLDCDVKVWAPSCEDPPSFRKIENVPLIHKCVTSNARNRAEETTTESDTFDSQMLWILLRHIRHTERNLNVRRVSSDQNQDDDDDDDDDDNIDDSSDDDSSDHSDSSEGDGIRRLQCPPS